MLRKSFTITKCDLSQKGKGGLKQENENLIKWGVGGRPARLSQQNQKVFNIQHAF